MSRHGSPDWTEGPPRPALRIATLAGAALAAFATVSLALASFSTTTSGGPMQFTTKRIFPGPRTTSPHDLRDASSGSEANASDPSSYAGDNLTYTSAGNMASGSNKYLEYTFESARPGGLSVSSAQFNFRLASGAIILPGNACFWLQVYSGGTLIGTHGSYASAAGCGSGGTQQTFNIAITEVTSTDQVNGLVVRVYAWETKGNSVTVDMATVTGSTPYSSFTAYENQLADTSNGTTTTAWSLASVDGTTYTSASAWPSNAPATTNYLKLTLDPSIPAGAVVTSVTLTNVWKPSGTVTGGALCYYLESFNGSTSLGTHGSSGSPLRCQGATTNVTDTVSLTEVNTVAKANGLVLKLYYWINTACGGLFQPACLKSVTDQSQVSFDYYLD